MTVGVLSRQTGYASLGILPIESTGYEVAMSIDLRAIVRIHDRRPRERPEDPDGILKAVKDVWKNQEYDIPSDKFWWTVDSEIPEAEGLGSSSAIAAAAFSCLNDWSEAGLDAAQLVDLTVAAHALSELDPWGGPAAAWAALEPGWHVCVGGHSAAEGRVLIGEREGVGEFRFFVVSRGPRKIDYDRQSAVTEGDKYAAAFAEIEQSSPFKALMLSGRVTSTALNDHTGRQIANDAIIKGARFAGLSGHGPAICVLLSENHDPSMLIGAWEGRGYEVIECVPR